MKKETLTKGQVGKNMVMIMLVFAGKSTEGTLRVYKMSLVKKGIWHNSCDGKVHIYLNFHSCCSPPINFLPSGTG